MADRAPIRSTGAAPVRLRHLPHGPLAPAGGGAFTLTEMVVVLGVIVLILAIAVPAVNLLSGSRSEAWAQNLLTAVLSQARGRAQALQRETGVLFYIDPATDRIAARMIEVVAHAGNLRQIDLVPQQDVYLLPPGVAIQFPTGAATGGTRTQPGYTGFNPVSGGSTRVGGAILFDRQGRLLVAPYWVRAQVGSTQTTLGALLGLTSNAVPSSPPVSHIGLTIFQRAPFEEQFTMEDPSGYPTEERNEERWLDENGTLLLINRYSGTFVE